MIRWWKERKKRKEILLALPLLFDEVQSMQIAVLHSLMERGIFLPQEVAEIAEVTSTEALHRFLAKRRDSRSQMTENGGNLEQEEPS